MSEYNFIPSIIVVLRIQVVFHIRVFTSTVRFLLTSVIGTLIMRVPWRVFLKYRSLAYTTAFTNAWLL